MACSKEPIPEPSFLAKVDQHLIQRETFETELQNRAKTLSPELSDDEIRTKVLDEIVHFQALYSKAIQAGIDKDPDIQTRIRQLIVREYENSLQDDNPPAQVSETDIAGFYAANQAQFMRKERRQGAIIFLSVPQTASEGPRREAMEKARSILSEARESGPNLNGLGLLAMKHSEDQATRYRHGDMGELELDGRYNRWERPVLEALFSLEKPGDLGPVIETPRGLYLIRLTSITPGAVKTLTEVSAQIRQDLERIRMKEQQLALQTAVRSGIDIQIHHDELSAIPVPRKPLTAIHPPSTPAR